jgi:N-acetylglucosaminyldiphosphoundecaprenol N-acetyl-beta-D-mannosaminyltransferase
MRDRTRVLKMHVDVTSRNDALNEITSWIGSGISKYVCVANVHMCMEVWDDSSFQKILTGADLVVADGRPIYWAQKLLGAKDAAQVQGMDLTPALCAYANQHRIAVGFYGGAPETLSRLKTVVEHIYPDMPAPLFISPPFRALTTEEKQAGIDAINDSGVKVLFVGLGCPKQERWMSENHPHLSCVILGVGANFDFIAGTQKHAPKILTVLGLEWFFRLCCEPRRLWRRYLSTNPRFIWYFAGQLMGRRY